MKSLSSAGVTLAIVTAAAVGVVATWMVMRQPRQQPPGVVVEEMPESSERASLVDPQAPIPTTKENQPRQLKAITPSNSFPRAAAPGAVSDRREPRDEPGQAASPEPSIPTAAVVYREVNGPVVQQANQPVVNTSVSPGKPQSDSATGTIEDALSFALEAAEPYAKEGFTVREDFWAGDLAVKGTKAIVHQLFKGNEYWFWAGTHVKEATLSVHIYDSEGKLAEVEAWAKPHFAAARVAPKKTGSYYLVVEVEKSNRQRTAWALAYGFR